MSEREKLRMINRGEWKRVNGEGEREGGRGREGEGGREGKGEREGGRGREGENDLERSVGENKRDEKVL